MAVIRWFDRPDFPRFSGEAERVQREMNELLSALGRSASPLSRSGVFPLVNVSEDTDNLYVRAELPGVQPGEIEISVEGETLTLGGERKLQAPEGVSYHRRERESGRFRRVITLPVRINPDAVTALFKNGALKITLPRAEETKPKKISVKTD